MRQFEGEVLVCSEDGTTLRGAQNDPLLGTTFADRYEIIAVIGFGGMSIVYKARHKLIDRIVAIKMLHGYLRSDASALERFKLEARAASSLNHPNIVTVYDYGITAKGEPFFVMDYMEGESLHKRLRRQGKLDYTEALAIFGQIAEGLSAAHKQGIIHRDLKPENIILTEQPGRPHLVKILDFGLAKVRNVHLTSPGQIYGSPLCMSPEQCKGLEPDNRSDIYSFGCLMYETLCGEPPLVGESVLETMNMQVGVAPISLKTRLKESGIPQELFKLVDSCLEKSPKDRPQNCDEILQALWAIPMSTSIAPGAPGQQRSTSSGHLKHSRKLGKLNIALLTTLTVSYCLSFYFLFTTGPDEDPGTMFDKIVLQFSIQVADNAIKTKDYSFAEKTLFFARDIASRQTDRKVRLEEVLKVLVKLYFNWEGHAFALEKTQREMVNIENWRVLEEAKAELAILSDLSANASLKVTAEEMRMKMEAHMPFVALLARRLIGRGYLQDSQELLEAGSRLGNITLPEDSPNLADLESVYGQSFELSREFQKARQHYIRACEIYKRSSKLNPDNYAHALSQLGQFDLNMNDFGNSESELSEALKIATQSKDNSLLVLTLRSYAELKRQTNKLDDWKLTLSKAEKLETTLTPHHSTQYQ